MRETQMLMGPGNYVKWLWLRSAQQPLTWGLLGLLATVPLALVVFQINSQYGDNLYFSTALAGTLFSAIIATPIAGYLLIKRKEANPATVGLIVIAAACISLLAVYFFRVSFLLSFPADILLWSESAFVSDIIKFRIGYPIYSDPLNNESFLYTPGTPIVTYLISSLVGIDFSIPFWRLMQLGFAILAAVTAFISARALLRMSFPSLQGRVLYPWFLLWLPVLFLIATNSITNPYVTNLHNDALALLISMVGYLLLLIYAATKRKDILLLMALVPVAGFLVKQNTAIWAFLYVVYLAFFAQARSIGRLAVFTVSTLGLLAVALAVGYMIWGNDFFYWVITVPASVKVSPLRSFQHVLDVWPFFAIGLFGGLALLRGERFNLLLGPWLVWLLLMLVGAYTSGNAYMTHHMGPGSLIAGIWFLTGLTKVWIVDLPRFVPAALPQKWLIYGVITATVILLFSGLGMVRVPTAPYSDDYFRYVRDIEKEFEGEAREKVLLDSGSWVYFGENIIMKDRVTSVGDRGNKQTGDFSGMFQRLEEKYYSKIMVRRLHDPDFWYDHYKMPVPTNLRAAILDNYVEVRVIEGVQGREDAINQDTYLADYISVLEPRPDETAASRNPSQ